MSEPKSVTVEVYCCPTARGITPEELAEFIEKGYIFLDVMPVRREITPKEKLTNPQIPPNTTHIAEPMIVFFRVGPAMPPLPEGAVEPGVN